ncbi:MAG: hypothetical protein V3V31_08085 [Methylococcales bacterium]
MIGKSGQNGLSRSRFSILGQPPRSRILIDGPAGIKIHNMIASMKLSSLIIHDLTFTLYFPNETSGWKI